MSSASRKKPVRRPSGQTDLKPRKKSAAYLRHEAQEAVSWLGIEDWFNDPRKYTRRQEATA